LPKKASQLVLEKKFGKYFREIDPCRRSVAYPEGVLGGLSTSLFQFAIFKIGFYVIKIKACSCKLQNRC